MGICLKMDKSKNYKYLNKALYLYSVRVIIIFSVLFSIYYYFESPIYANTTRILNNYYQSELNSKYELNRSAKAESQNNMIISQIVLLDKKDKQGNAIIKTIGIDFRMETALPFILCFSLLTAAPLLLKKKIAAVMTGMFICSFYIYVKLYSIIFDNFNYPELSVKKLNIFSGFIVEIVNRIINISGSSSSFIVPVVISVFIMFYCFDDLNFYNDGKQL